MMMMMKMMKKTNHCDWIGWNICFGPSTRYF